MNFLYHYESNFKITEENGLHEYSNHLRDTLVNPISEAIQTPSPTLPKPPLLSTESIDAGASLYSTKLPYILKDIPIDESWRTIISTKRCPGKIMYLHNTKVSLWYARFGCHKQFHYVCPPGSNQSYNGSKVSDISHTKNGSDLAERNRVVMLKMKREQKNCFKL